MYYKEDIIEIINKIEKSIKEVKDIRDKGNLSEIDKKLIEMIENLSLLVINDSMITNGIDSSLL
jgi:hypothetical protein